MKVNVSNVELLQCITEPIMCNGVLTCQGLVEFGAYDNTVHGSRSYSRSEGNTWTRATRQLASRCWGNKSQLMVAIWSCYIELVLQCFTEVLSHLMLAI